MTNSETVARGSAREQITVFIDRFAVTLREAVGVGIAVIGLLTRAPTPASLAVLIAYLGYSVLRLVLGQAPTPARVLVADVGAVLLLALATPVLCTPEEARSLSGLTSVGVAAASVTLVWQLRGWWPVAWCAAAMLAAAVGGSLVPGVHPSQVLLVWFLPVQSVVVWALMALLRRAAERADRAGAALAETVHSSELAALRRTAEREYWAVLHDTAAATLLMVGDGVPASAATRVRDQARRDLDTLTRPQTAPAGEAPPTPARLAPVLRAVAAEFPLQVSVSDPDAVQVPARVLAALRDAVRELLTNVERHAEVQTARVEVSEESDGVVRVDVVDAGSGFDPDSAEGRGLRESVRGRVARAGGEVAVLRPPGGGVHVRLRWPAS